jgi:peroxiredoxin
MKKIFITALAAITLFACSKQTNYTITGTVAIPEMEGSQVFLFMRGEDGLRSKIDSATIIDGTYNLVGTVKNPSLGMLLIGDGIEVEGQYAFWAEFIAENGNITITTDEERQSRVSGTKNNDLFQTFSDAQHDFFQEMEPTWMALHEAREAGNEALVQTLSEESKERWEEWMAFMVEFIKNNINNPAGRGVLSSNVSALSVEQMKEAISKATKATLKTSEVERIVTRIETLEKTAVGQPFTDFRMQDLDGNEIALSDFAGKGNYVMIDFTATWCGPCIHGKPAMIATYNRFKDKGFEIVSVWFDSDREAWINAAKALPWHAHMSDLNGWENEAREFYSINFIPQSVLIDREGIIIAKNLRGEDLDEKLAELMP